MLSQHKEKEVEYFEIEKKIGNFLLAVGESLPKWAEGGVCNGFAFAAFRSELYHQAPQYQKRLANLANETKESLENLGKVLLKYRENLQFFSNKMFYQKGLKKALAHLHPEKDQREIAYIKKTFFNQVKRKAIKHIKNKKLLQQACDYYNFIHMLLAAQDPGEKIALKNNERYVHQEDFLEILKLLPIDGPEKKVDQVFNFALNLSVKELEQVFAWTLYTGDHVQIATIDHVAYVRVTDNQYVFYNPEPVFIPRENKLLAKMIKTDFFTASDINAKSMPLAIHIFSERKGLNRPSVDFLFKELMQKRGREKKLNQLSESGVTSVYMAAFDNCQEVLRSLIAAGANLDIPNTKMNTPASIAAQHDNAEIIKILASHHAHLNKANLKQYTPLHFAAKRGFLTTVHTLLDAKANLYIKNNCDETPLMSAIRNHHWNVASVLYHQMDKTLIARDLRDLRRELKMSPDELALKLGEKPVRFFAQKKQEFPPKNFHFKKIF